MMAWNGRIDWGQSKKKKNTETKWIDKDKLKIIKDKQVEKKWLKKTKLKRNVSRICQMNKIEQDMNTE